MRRALLGALLASGLAPSRAAAEWPLADPDAPASALARPENQPDDPGFAPADDPCRGQLDLYAFVPPCAARLDPEEADQGVGLGVDRAWLLTRGDPRVVVAILDEGFDLGDPDLGRAVWLNPGELPPPEPGDGTHDANGDGRFDVLDYTSATGTTAPTLARVTDARLRSRPDGGDANANGRLDPDDLWRVFADGADDDGNGLTDDIAGWDFVDGDGDVAPRSRAPSPGTAAARVVAATTNNATGIAGICPECRVLPIRVGIDGAADPDDVASGFALAGDVGAVAAVVGVDAPTRASWRPAIDDVLVLHDAGPRGAPFVLDPLEGWVVGGYGPDAAPEVATTFRAVEDCGRDGPEIGIRAPTGCDGTAAARVGGIVGLVQSFAIQLHGPEGRLTPAAVRGLLGATRRPERRIGIPFGDGEPVTSARPLDARAALEALRRGAAQVVAEISRPAPGALVDPDRPLVVEGSVGSTAPGGAAWTLDAELGPGGRPPRARRLASGRGDGLAPVRWTGPVGVWFEDPVAPPRRAEHLGLTLVLTVDPEGPAPLRVERRVYVHRDLRAWTDRVEAVPGGVQAGLRRGRGDGVIVASTEGRAFLVGGAEEIWTLLEAPPARRLRAGELFGLEPTRPSPLEPLRTAPTRLDEGRWAFPTAPGDVLLWVAADASREIWPAVLRPGRGAPRPLLWTGSLIGVDDGGVVPVATPDRRVDIPRPPGSGANDGDRVVLADSETLWRVDPAAGTAAPEPVAPSDGPAPSPILFPYDGRVWVAAAWPGQPWGVRPLDGGEPVNGLPTAAGPHLLAADLDGDDHPDLVGPAEDPELGRVLAAWSLRNGAPLDGFPVPLPGPLAFPPIAEDLDGDRRPDVIFMATGGQIDAVGRGGTRPSDFPKLVGGPVVATPLVTDIDGDDRNDLFVARRDGVFLGYRTTGRPSASFAWPEARHDSGATANATTRIPPVPDAGGGGGGCRSTPGAALAPLALALGLIARRRRTGPRPRPRPGR